MEKYSIAENLDCTTSSSSSLNTDLQLYDSTDLPYPHSTVVSTSLHEKTRCAVNSSSTMSGVKDEKSCFIEGQTTAVKCT